MSCLNALNPVRSKFLAAALAIGLGWSLGFPSASYAFPELSRHGYVNCTACHVSPTGGGVLNSYGRELSRELVSFRSAEGEQDLLHGLAPGLRAERLPPQIAVGGDVRAIQTYRDTSVVRQGMFLLMQAEAELAWHPGPATLVGSLGRQTDGTQTWIGSHRFWGGYSPTEESMVRAGLFYPAFGLNIPEHFLSVRRGMGFDEGMETYNLEVSWLGERYSAYLTGGAAPTDKVGRAQKRDNAVSLQLNRNFGESVRVGASYLWGSARTGAVTQAAALHGTIGLWSRAFLMGELNSRWVDSAQSSNRLVKLGYEPWQGWVFGLFNDAGYTTAGGREGAGVSVQLFPRPHFQVDLAAEKQFSSSSMPEGDTFGWLLLHYYL